LRRREVAALGAVAHADNGGIHACAVEQN
jgi:hypothetical protein